MHGTLPGRVADARAIERKLLQGAATLCSPSKFSIAWKALFPFKAAEELAARTGRSVRAASYVLSGEQPPSGLDIAALVHECTKRE